MSPVIWLAVVGMAGCFAAAVAFRDVPVIAGVLAGSIALIGNGLDSGIEALASIVVVWRFAAARISSDRAEQRAQRIIALTRQMLWQYSAAAHPFDLLQMDGPLSVELGSGPDVREGVAAFLEKRKPNFPSKVSAGLPSRYKPASR